MLQDSYNKKIMTINEAKVYSNILSTVIGAKHPEDAQMIGGVLSIALSLAELTVKFNNPSQAGLNISATLLTGNYIMAGLQLFSMFTLLLFTIQLILFSFTKIIGYLL